MGGQGPVVGNQSGDENLGRQRNIHPSDPPLHRPMSCHRHHTDFLPIPPLLCCEQEDCERPNQSLMGETSMELQEGLVAEQLILGGEGLLA